MIIKRNGELQSFDFDKIAKAVIASFKACYYTSGWDLALGILETANVNLGQDDSQDPVSIETIQEYVEDVLMEYAPSKVAKAYIKYRDRRAVARLEKEPINKIERYLARVDDMAEKENSSMQYSLQGMHNFLFSSDSEEYWMSLLPDKIKEAHQTGRLHFHDASVISPYCMGWDLQQLLLEGFRGVPTKTVSAPPKHLRTAFGQMVNFLYTMSGEAAGAQAFSNINTLLAPFVRHDKLNYEEVKQHVQEFVYNMNISTRVGFQCFDESTEILTKEGWRTYEDILEGDEIQTLNLETNNVELKPVKKLFAREYKGEMYSLKNRITDQLISPKHRVVRKKFNSDKLELVEIEEVAKNKSGIIIPVATKGVLSESTIDLNMVKLAAWIITEGSVDRNGRGIGRITIYQKDTSEIKKILDSLSMAYTESFYEAGFGSCGRLRLNSEAASRVYEFFESDKHKGLKFIPKVIKESSVGVAKLFIDTFLKGDGDEERKRTTTVFPILVDDLMEMAIKAGYSATSYEKKGGIHNKQKLYTVNFITTENTTITDISTVDYEGIIWCPTTDNETVFARRNGKIFISGNSPFSNITLDTDVTKTSMAEEYVIIGGEYQDTQYKEYQEEAAMVAEAIVEVMEEGDAAGAMFPYPIVTFNVTKDFPWESRLGKKIAAATVKYGPFYFANFINSEFAESDIKSMCCRLRLDLTEVQKHASGLYMDELEKTHQRGGGFFGASPKTGSIGVVTLGLPAIMKDAMFTACLRSDLYPGNPRYKEIVFEEQFLSTIRDYMDLAMDAINIRRKTVEMLADKGLYPFTTYYMRDVKERTGHYFSQHFNTIGLNGMHEALLVLGVEEGISSEIGQKLTLEMLDFMNAYSIELQKKHGILVNLEQTPAESAGVKLCNKSNIDPENKGYYTNSTWLPADFKSDIFELVDFQSKCNRRYTGGTATHLYTDDDMRIAPEMVGFLITKLFTLYDLPYLDIAPNFSICKDCGQYHLGRVENCQTCGEETIYWARIVGYHRPVENWNAGRKKEQSIRASQDILETAEIITLRKGA